MFDMMHRNLQRTLMPNSYWGISTLAKGYKTARGIIDGNSNRVDDKMA
jgi:hypothetical protein